MSYKISVQSIEVRGLMCLRKSQETRGLFLPSFSPYLRIKLLKYIIHVFTDMSILDQQRQGKSYDLTLYMYIVKAI